MEHRKDALYDIDIKAPNIARVKLNDANYYQALFAVDRLLKETMDNQLIEMITECYRTFGFSSMDNGSYKVYISASLPKIKLAGVQTCGRRMQEVGPWEHTAGLDYWELVGKDKICSFCGSLAPSSVLEIVKEKGAKVIEIAKTYKWYVKRDDVPNAAFGGIKYYRHHDTPEFLEEMQALFDAAKEEKK